MAFDSINAGFSFESRFKSVLRSFSFVSENIGSTQDHVHYIPKQENFCGLRWNWHEHEFPASRRSVVSVPSSAYKALIHKIEKEKFEYNTLFIGVQCICNSPLISFLTALKPVRSVEKESPLWVQGSLNEFCAAIYVWAMANGKSSEAEVTVSTTPTSLRGSAGVSKRSSISMLHKFYSIVNFLTEINSE